MEKKFIVDFKVNEHITSTFILRTKNLKLTKHDKPYLQLSLQDKTGKIEGRVWDGAEKFSEGIEAGDVVKVAGSVDKYREQKQLKVDSIEKADDRDYVYEDLVRALEGRDEIYEKILSYLDEIKGEWMSLLVKEFTGDEELMTMFRDGIGAKSWHNAYIGGLAEHTWEVMAITDKMCELYPEVDREVALFGAMLHDIGKVYELDAKKFEYTIAGGLVGHISIGHKILVQKMRNIPGFSEDLALRLEHIVLSHHGEYEQQSPVLPKTLEATIVYQADELVSQANAVKELSAAQAAEGKVWSDYVSIKSRKYFIQNFGEKAEDISSEDKKEDLFK